MAVAFQFVQGFLEKSHNGVGAVLAQPGELPHRDHHLQERPKMATGKRPVPGCCDVVEVGVNVVGKFLLAVLPGVNVSFRHELRTAGSVGIAHRIRYACSFQLLYPKLAHRLVNGDAPGLRAPVTACAACRVAPPRNTANFISAACSSSFSSRHEWS